MSIKSLIAIVAVAVTFVSVFAFSDINAKEDQSCSATITTNPGDYLIGFTDCSYEIVSSGDANYSSLSTIHANATSQSDAFTQLDNSGMYSGRTVSMWIVHCCEGSRNCSVSIPTSCSVCASCCNLGDCGSNTMEAEERTRVVQW